MGASVNDKSNEVMKGEGYLSLMGFWGNVDEPSFDIDLIQEIALFDLDAYHNDQELQIVQIEEANRSNYEQLIKLISE